MSTTKENFSLNSSAASSQPETFEDIEVLEVKNYVKDLLKSRIFLGRYIERRLTAQRVGYRDVVLISAAEVDLKRDLLEVQYKLRQIFPSTHWIGITNSEVLGYDPPGVSLWTEIDNQPFGPFWFQIKGVKFRNEEIIVSVKCLRHISDAFLEAEPILTRGSKKSKGNTESNAETAVTSLNESYREFVATLKTALSITNVGEFIKFVCAFVIAVFTGSTSFVNFLGNFILAAMREMSIFTKNATPLFLGFLDFLSKIVGGFYILLAMLFKPSSNPIPSNKRQITYDRPHHSSQYDDRYFD